MADPKLRQRALALGLNPAAAGGMDNTQLWKYVQIREKQAVPKPATTSPFDFKAPSGRVVVGPTVNPIQRATNPAIQSQIGRDRREALRRQRILRGAGYGVVVDGIWGPRSQAAWMKHQRGPGSSVVFKRHGGSGVNLSSPARASVQEHELFQASVERAAQQQARVKLAEERQAKRERDRQLKEQRQAILNTAATLRRNPATAARMNLHDLTLALSDREADLDFAKNPQAALAVQHFLRAKGYKVQLTGKPDEATAAAFTEAIRRENKRTRRKQIDTIRRDVYRPLGLKVGKAAPAGFPLKTVPTEQEMIELLDEGGFTASRVFAWVQRHPAVRADVWGDTRSKQLALAARQYAPFLLPAGLGGGSILESLGVLYGLDGNDLLSESDRLKIRADGGDDAVRVEERKAVLALRDQINAAMRSKNPSDMRKKLLAYEAVSEQKLIRYQSELAKGGWFSKTIGALAKPMELALTGGTYALMEGLQTATRSDERDVRWEDAAVSAGLLASDELDGYDGLAAPMTKWLTIPAMFVVDPLIVAAPFKALSSGSRLAFGSRQLGHWSLVGKGAYTATRGRRLIGASDGVFSKALVYNKGTWSKAAAARTVPGLSALERTRPGEWTKSKAQRAGRLKEEAVAAVNTRIGNAIRQGFDPASEFASGYGLRKRPKNLAALRAAQDAFEETARSNPEFIPVVNDLVTERASIYLDADRKVVSSYGASVRANLAEKSRVHAVTKIVYRSIDKMAEARGYARLSDEVAEAYKSGDTAKAAALNEQRKALQQELVDEARRLMESAGVYIKGGSYKSLKDTDLAAMAKAIRAETFKALDTIDNIYLPTFQNIAEKNADEAFAAAKQAAKEATGDGVRTPATHPLWDESGLWAGRNGEAAQKLRERARASFADEIDVQNPVHGVGHSWDEAAEAIEDEIGRRLPRLYEYALREKIRLGKSFTFDADEEAETIRKEIMGAWESRPDGLFYDARPTIKINKLYAQNFQEAADSFIGNLEKHLHDDGFLDVFGLERVAATPPRGTFEEMDDALGRLAFQIVGPYKGVKNLNLAIQKGTAAKTRPVPSPPSGLGPSGAANWMAGEFNRLAEIGQRAAKLKIEQKRAVDSVLAAEYKSEGLLLRALGASQNKALKTAYLAINGFLQVWKFATLALRPGWVARNVIDNSAKALVQGARDPRHYFIDLYSGAYAKYGKAGSVFTQDFQVIRAMSRYFDGMFGTSVTRHLDELLERSLWSLPPDDFAKLLGLHGVPAAPPAVLDGARFTRQLDSWTSGKPAAAKVSLSDYIDAGEDIPFGARIEKFLGSPHGKLADEANAVQRLAFKMRKSPDTLYALMGDKPENFYKRVIYRSEMNKALKEYRAAGTYADETEMYAAAHERAWDAVTDTLFDYSQMSVAEDNLRVFMPFVQFWRKNTTFWAQNMVSKPWLPVSILKADQLRRDMHGDLPDWMRRYLHTDEILDAAATVPGLAPIVAQLLPDDEMFDPLSMLSFAPLHRLFREYVYGDNPNLSPQDKGRGILAPLIRAMDEWGLGLNPIVRKPLEVSGLADTRDWQSVFPQTSLAVAFSLKFFNEETAFKIANWERVFTLGEERLASELAENYDVEVNREMLRMKMKGEEPDIEVARATVKTALYVRQLWAYFGGVYWREGAPQDIHIAKLQDEEYDDLTDKEKSLLSSWAFTRKASSPEEYARYLDHVPLLQAYYRQTDWAERDKMIEQHPALSKYVNGGTGKIKGIGSTWIRDAERYYNTGRFFHALKMADTLDVAPDVKDDAYRIFVTPQLKEWWARNDTPKQIRDRMVQGEMRRYIRDLQKSYFSIPEADYEARDGFLAAHPELPRAWAADNDPSDDWEALNGNMKADLRNLYFEVLEAKGFEAAAPILKEFPFMFEGTKSEKKIKDGEWIGGGSSGWSKDRREAWGRVSSFSRWFFDVHMKKVGEDKAWEWLRKSDDPKAKLFTSYLAKYGKQGSSDWSAARRELFLQAKPTMTWFFDTFMPKVGEKKAWAWLDTAEGPGVEAMKQYFKQYGKSSAKRTDYLKAKPYLALYEKMAPDAKRAWLEGDSEGAKIVRWFFDKYSSDKDMSARGRAWLDVKKELDFYGSLPKEKRQAWLESDDPRAAKVLAFFKKYGKDHQFERAFKKLIAAYPGLEHGTAEQAERIRFWKHYFTLPPDQRPAFVHDHAEDSGIFMYGDVSEQYRHDREREFMRRAIGAGVSKRAAAYLYVKPMLDFYRTLDSKEKPLFLRANPDLQDYFDTYVKRSFTGDKKLDALVEQYFKLAANSPDRSAFLRKHPDVQRYFDAKASPAERALRAVLVQYFDIDNPDLRAAFLAEHPEVAEYFDRRREERRLERDQYEAFDASDPRQRPYRENAADLIRAAEAQRARLRGFAETALTIENRRERRRT